MGTRGPPHYGRDTYGSRATVIGGTAILMCIEKILAKGTRLAAHLLKAKEKDVVVRTADSSPGAPKNALTLHATRRRVLCGKRTFRRTSNPA